MSKKQTLLIFIGFLVLSSSTVFGIYIYYRKSINPKPVEIEDIKVINNSVENEIEIESNLEKDVFYSTTDEEIALKSVFETALATTKYLNEKGEKTLPLNSINEQLDDVIVNQKTNEIISHLYNETFEEAVSMAKEISETYDFTDDNFRNFEIFIYEVLNFENYESLSISQKIEFLKGLHSPELILYIYLTIDETTRMEITKNKAGSGILGSFNSLSYSVYFKSHLEAGLYSEMDINNAYFVIPDDIKGYKIKFLIDTREYILYYVRNTTTDKIEIIKLDNLSIENGATINDFINQ